MPAIHETRTDVVIVGAGAAGLAAAKRLREHGVRVVILEARNRLGGRIHTVRHPQSALPIELGAEFLHGNAEEVLQIAKEAGLTKVDVTGERWRTTGGRFSRIENYWERLDRILGQADAKREPDRSLAAFLAEKPGGRRFADDRKLVREFVEGFHAAELDRISERAIADGGNPGEDPQEQKLGRLLEGYGAIIDWLAKPLLPSTRVGRVVTVVDWSPGRVRVAARTSGGRTEIVRGRAAIITVPVSLLQPGGRGRGALTFSPEVPSIRAAADCATMGHVRRVILLLDRPVVEILPESRRERFARLAFLHAPAVAIPVWWNSYPLRSGIAVGWAGGPAALELEATPRDLAPRAISALASAFALGRRTVSRHVRGVFTHDWTKDPFSRGAYSYSLVGGSDVGQRLSRPVAETLFLAGEAADSEGRSGTVHGAIGSGFGAARRVLRALGRA